MDIKVGDIIGGIFFHPSEKDRNKKEWYICSGKVKRITSNTKGTKVFTKEFYPMDMDEILENTKQMKEAVGYINVRDVVLLDEQLMDRCQRWVAWANKNPEKVSMLGG